MKRFSKTLSAVIMIMLLAGLLPADVDIFVAKANVVQEYGTVLIDEDFGNSQTPDGTSLNGFKNWIFENIGSGQLNNSVNTIQTEDGTGNKVANLLRTGVQEEDTGKDKGGTDYLRLNIPSDAYEDNTTLFYLKFRLRRTDNNANRFHVKVISEYEGKNSVEGPHFRLNENKINHSLTDPSFSADMDNKHNPLTVVNKWYNVEMFLDYNVETFTLYMDGSKLSEGNFRKSTTGIGSLPKALAFSSTRKFEEAMIDPTKDANFQLDDVYAASYTDEQAISQAVERISRLDGAKVACDIALPETVEFGTSISWDTNESAVIDASGGVTRPLAGNEAVEETITAAIVRKDAPAVNMTKDVVISVLPQNVHVFEDFNTHLLGDGLTIIPHHTTTNPVFNDWYNYDNALTSSNRDRNVFIEREPDTNNNIASFYNWPGISSPVLYRMAKNTTNCDNCVASLSFKLKRGNENTRRFILHITDADKKHIEIDIDFTTCSVRTNQISGYPDYKYDLSKEEPDNWLNLELLFDMRGENALMRVLEDGVPLALNGEPTGWVETTRSLADGIARISFGANRTLATTVNTTSVSSPYAAQFTLDDIMLKTLANDEISCIEAADKVSFPSIVSGNLTFPDYDSETGALYENWSSDNASVITREGYVNSPSDLTKVKLSADIVKGNAKITRSWYVDVSPVYLTSVIDIVGENTITALNINNAIPLSGSPYAFIASYDVENGVKKLIKIAAVPITDSKLEKGEQTLLLNTGFEIPDNTVTNVYIWNLDSLKPYSVIFSQ